MSKRAALPKVTRAYQNHHIDSTHWQVFKPHPDDIIVATTQKSGTTSTQQIVSLLLFQDGPPPARFHDLSVFVDMLKDLSGQIKRIADYLDIDVTPEYLQKVTELCTFESIKSAPTK